MKFKQKTRTRLDTNREISAKQLPVHPVTRYSKFSPMWKKTRRKGGYIPIPNNKDEDLFPCCLACQNTKPDNSNEALWKKTANAQWLRAEWKWDFGWTLPEGLISYGVGVTVPIPAPKKNQVFVLNPNLDRKRLEFTLEEHATLGGEFQHEAKIRVVPQPGFEQVVFEGQFLGSSFGYLVVATPRQTWFQDGKEVWKRFTFEYIQMPYELNNLLYNGENIKVENNKVFLNGVEL